MFLPDFVVDITELNYIVVLTNTCSNSVRYTVIFKNGNNTYQAISCKEPLFTHSLANMVRNQNFCCDIHFVRKLNIILIVGSMSIFMKLHLHFEQCFFLRETNWNYCEMMRQFKVYIYNSSCPS